MDAFHVTMVSLDELYRKFSKWFDFKVIEPVLKGLESLSNYGTVNKVL